MVGLRRNSGRRPFAMGQKKQKRRPSIRAHKVRSKGLWIAPGLERTIKGESGRRGLTEPPHSYYLDLADLMLKPSRPLDGTGRKDGKLPAARFNAPSGERIANPPAPILPTSRWRTLPSNPVVDTIPAPLPPTAPGVNLPKLNLPKPPKRERRLRPPSLAGPEMPRQADRPKLSAPKPPKRGR
jgi:hypothetical protein